MANYPDLSGRANYNRGQMSDVQGLVIHHTGGRGTASGIVDVLNTRGLGAHYVMERDGTIYQTLAEGARGAHMEPASKYESAGALNPNLNNSNTIGIEIIAHNNGDLTDAQKASAQRFIADQRSKYPGIGDNVYGHGELNPGHKQATEGMAVVGEFRDKNGISKKDVTKTKNANADKVADAAAKGKDDGKKGEGKGDESKKEDHEKTAKEKSPLKKKDHEDTKGAAGNYQKTTTQSIVGRMPTHEPWLGHPKSTEGPRQALRGDGGANNGGAGTDADRGSGGSSASPGGGGGGGGGGRGGTSNGGGANITDFKAPGNFDAKAPVIMARLQKDLGITENQAAGIVGNLGHETAGFTQYQELAPRGGGRGGFGWAQWTGPRRRDFEAWSASKGLDVRSDEANYGFLVHELTGKESASLAAIKRTETVEDATRVFEQKYERAGVVALGSRLKYAAKAKQKAQENKGKPRTGDDGMNRGDEKGKPLHSGGTAPKPAGGSSAVPTS